MLTPVFFRPKMYKQRLRRWGFRKNIRVLEAEDEIDCYALENVGEDTTSNGAPPVVQLASGQVVNLDRLANHLRRKMMYRRSVQNVLVPCSIKPPERYYVCEAVLDNTRAYLVSAANGGMILILSSITLTPHPEPSQRETAY